MRFDNIHQSICHRFVQDVVVFYNRLCYPNVYVNYGHMNRIIVSCPFHTFSFDRFSDADPFRYMQQSCSYKNDNGIGVDNKNQLHHQLFHITGDIFIIATNQ